MRQIAHGRGSCRGGFQTRPGRLAQCPRRGVLWQRGYYEHVIRNKKAIDRIRAYIVNIQKISRELALPKLGGFETRPYRAPDLCTASRKRALW